MDGNLAVATAILAGFWLGRNTQISDLGGKIKFDPVGFLIRLAKSKILAYILIYSVGFLWFVFLELISRNDLESLLSSILFLLADQAGAYTARLAANRYSSIEVPQPLPLSEYKTPVSLFDNE